MRLTTVSHRLRKPRIWARDEGTAHGRRWGPFARRLHDAAAGSSNGDSDTVANVAPDGSCRGNAGRRDPVRRCWFVRVECLSVVQDGSPSRGHATELQVEAVRL